ncbi:MAG TPA: hypothetical protein VFX18_02215, partial [Candidatus Nitrosocosmicus sp.]|nr:hypothetical protein [Candidatus Nitrosocosmicus sp.]
MRTAPDEFSEKIMNKPREESTEDNSNIKDEYNLRSFLSILSDKNELLVIDKKIKAKFQLASIVAKFDKKEAILFTDVENKKFKV